MDKEYILLKYLNKFLDMFVIELTCSMILKLTILILNSIMPVYECQLAIRICSCDHLYK